MKILSFNEYHSFEITSTDIPDVKLAKEKLNLLQKQLSEYKTKKNLIDKIYSNLESTNDMIQSELDKVFGTQQEDKNPFLVDYTTVARLLYSIEKKKKSNAEDKIKLDDLNQELSNIDRGETRDALAKKIQDIKTRIKDREMDVNDLNREVELKENEHKDKMKKVEEDIREYSSKI